MDLGSLSLCVCVMMVCLLGAAHCSNGDNNDCPCPQIPTHPLTKPPPGTCYKINTTFRYECVDGYVRRAGTSNLIKCRHDTAKRPEWSMSRLSCIPDPNRVTTRPPKTTVTTPSTSQQMTHYASSSPSVTTKMGSTEPTSSGSGQRSLSDHTQGKTLAVTPAVTERKTESVRVTRTVAWTTSNSTLSLFTVKNNITLIHEPRTGLNRTTAAVIACVSLMIIFSVIGICLLCYRRRSIKNMPLQTEEEMIPMKHAPSGTASGSSAGNL